MTGRDPRTVRIGAPRRRVPAPLVMLVVVALLVVGGVVWIVRSTPGPPGCTAGIGTRPVSLTVEQADNAATIAGVGGALGMPDHAVTVALATALQESGLRNLSGGDRDSAGLFQQRPSQGWGTYEQVTDPVYAASAFYRKLRTEPDWPTLDVAEAAQLIQRSADGPAYAQWETQARTMAIALTGQGGAALTCENLSSNGAPEDVARVAAAELGTAALSGPHDAARGWALANWLVAHAARFGLDQVTYDGTSWSSGDGTWSATGPSDGRLSLRHIGNSGG